MKLLILSLSLLVAACNLPPQSAELYLQTPRTLKDGRKIYRFDYGVPSRVIKDDVTPGVMFCPEEAIELTPSVQVDDIVRVHPRMCRELLSDFETRRTAGTEGAIMGGVAGTQ